MDDKICYAWCAMDGRNWRDGTMFVPPVASQDDAKEMVKAIRREIQRLTGWDAAFVLVSLTQIYPHVS